MLNTLLILSPLRIQLEAKDPYPNEPNGDDDDEEEELFD